MNSKTYEINGKTYLQRPLVLGQIMPIIDLIEATELTELSAMAVIQQLGPSLPEIMAIVLIPEGVRLRNKDLHAMAAEFDEHMTIETALEVVEDFFSCNPLSSISARMKGAMLKMTEEATEALSARTSNGSLKTSATETSPGGPGSSGM